MDTPDFKLPKNRRIDYISIRDAENGLSVDVSTINIVQDVNGGNYGNENYVFTDEDAAFSFIKKIFDIKKKSKR